jgi:DNA topoisomerase 6 subunit A-like protein
MSAAEDIKFGLTKNLKTFTKQRKAEERNVGAERWRISRITEVRGEFLNEAVAAVLVVAYEKVSDNGQLRAEVRQIFYVVRPLIENRIERPLTYNYFSQTILPDYLSTHPECAGWDVVWDDRGHFMEPHTKREIGLGTLAVRNYLARVAPMKFKEADFARAEILTYGPIGCFSALLYIEKEGFFPLFEKVKLAQRYDIGIMSSKGMSVTAARQLADGICGAMGVPLLVLHDFDRPGIIIKDTLENDTRRYTYTHAINVIDLGLNLEDIGDLVPEPHNSKISDQRLEEAGISEDAIHFLRTQRVELNAMTSRQLVDFIERKLKQHSIRKVIPNRKILAKTYQLFAKSNRLAEAFEELKEKLEDETEEVIEAPGNLEAKVKATLKKKPDVTWHRAVRLIIDPNAPDDDDDEFEEEDDED